jgi:hypothetical protein
MLSDFSTVHGARLRGAPYGLRSPLDEMRSGAVLFLHLFYGLNLPGEAREFGKFLLDRLQPFMPLAVRDFSVSVVPVSTPIQLVQLLDVSDLRSETPNSLPQDFKLVHTIRIAQRDDLSVGSLPVCEVRLSHEVPLSHNGRFRIVW